MLEVAVATDRTNRDVCNRVNQLVQAHTQGMAARRLIRDICGGGEAGLRAILGANGTVDGRSVPAANMILSGLTRLGQKIGRMPDLRVDMPPAGDGSENARKRAERVRRIVVDYDRANLMEQKVAQVGLWLPAYGFASLVVVDGMTPDGHPYPRVEARDPYGTFPGEFGNAEQPRDCAWVWTWPLAQLKAWCDRHGRGVLYDRIVARRNLRGPVILEPSDYPVPGSVGNWTSPGGSYGTNSQGVTVAEYRNGEGTWLVVPECDAELGFWANPLMVPTFHVARRVTVGELIGHYDHAIGLQSALVEMNTLALIALKDATFAETVIEGQVLSGRYRRGRFATNIVTPGTNVSTVKRDVPYQYFSEIARMEQQFRTTVGYPVTDDAVSPAAQATGQGIERLNAPIDLEVKQYYDIIDRMLEAADASRLEWDEKCYPGQRKPLVGTREGQPYAEYYTPQTHIKGWYRTRRTHGAMAGLSDSAKAVALLQFKGAGIIDADTVRDNLEGLGDTQAIKEAVKAERAEEALIGAMTQGVPLDPRVALTLIEMMPEGKPKSAMRKFWTPEEPQMSPEEEAMLAAPPAAPQMAGPPPDAATMLARLSANGAGGGVQLQGAL